MISDQFYIRLNLSRLNETRVDELIMIGHRFIYAVLPDNPSLLECMSPKR
jgi:hypothetical protein